jgi:multiple sugar transport system substrate-binding protein
MTKKRSIWTISASALLALGFVLTACSGPAATPTTAPTLAVPTTAAATEVATTAATAAATTAATTEATAATTAEATTAATAEATSAATTAATSEATSAATTAATEAPTAAPTPTIAPFTGTVNYTGTVMQVEDGASIVFSGWGDSSEQQVYHDSIARFNKVYPNVKVDYQPIPSDFQTKLKAAMAGGTAPDVFYVDAQLMAAFGPTNQLLPLDDLMKDGGVSRDDFVPSLLSLFTLNGKTLALPKDWGTLGLIYLPAAFQAAGIPEPTASWTWDDLKNAAAKIAATGKYAGFCQAADYARLAPFVYGAGGTFVSDDFKNATLNTPEVKAAVDLVAGMKTDGSLKTPSDLGAGWCGEAVGKQLAGMTYEGGWMVNFMKTTYPDVQWKAVPLPAGPKGQADIVFTNGIGVNAATKYPRASAALAMFITGAYNQGEIVKTGFAYSTQQSQLGLLTNPNDQAIAQGGTWPLTHVDYYGVNTGNVQTALNNALSHIFLGDMNSADALTQAQTDVQSALAGQ